MTISLFGLTVIRARELDAIRTRLRDLEQAADAGRPGPGRGGQAAGDAPPLVVDELVRLADRLPAMSAHGAQLDPGQAAAAARWLDQRVQAALAACEVTRVEDDGALDLRRHEVVGTRAAPSESLAHQIAQTVRPGYAWHDRVLRAQQVVAYVPAAGKETRTAGNEGS
jgi:hypothetical protein